MAENVKRRIEALATELADMISVLPAFKERAFSIFDLDDLKEKSRMQQLLDVAVAEEMGRSSNSCGCDEIGRWNLRSGVDRAAVASKAAYEAQSLGLLDRLHRLRQSRP